MFLLLLHVDFTSFLTVVFSRSYEHVLYGPETETFGLTAYLLWHFEFRNKMFFWWSTLEIISYTCNFSPENVMLVAGHQPGFAVHIK